MDIMGEIVPYTIIMDYFGTPERQPNPTGVALSTNHSHWHEAISS
jgi:hypothetical protein